jgi:hypothetical protein
LSFKDVSKMGYNLKGKNRFNIRKKSTKGVKHPSNTGFFLLGKGLV